LGGVGCVEEYLTIVNPKPPNIYLRAIDSSEKKKTKSEKRKKQRKAKSEKRKSKIQNEAILYKFNCGVTASPCQ
jgi:hypothetical protein